jgi:hypothetical protein
VTEEQIMSILTKVGAGILICATLATVISFVGARWLLGKGWFKKFRDDMRKAFRGP